jgi:capsular exopolysaccharide synthesis family protein
MTRLAAALERAHAANRPAKRPDDTPPFTTELKSGPTGLAKPPVSAAEPPPAPAAVANVAVSAPEPPSAPAAVEKPVPTARELTSGPVAVVKLPPVTPDASPAPAKPPRPSAAIPLLRVPADLAAHTPVHVDPALGGKLIGTAGVPFGCVEQYRKLAATLHHIQAERGIKVLLVSSAVAGEGKTLTSTNIALTLSESYGKKVLIVDADLRRPTMHQVFDLPNLTGLSDALRSDKDRTLSLTQVATRLSALTAGRPDPDPMSGLTSPRLRRIVQEASSLFDWVIIDTPPAGLLPDAKLIGALADASVLVIRSGRAPVQLVMQAVEALGRERIVGVVLNGVEGGASGAAPYYGYGYYAYGGHDPASRGTRG